MPPPGRSQRRRRRSDVESDDDADGIRNSPRPRLSVSPSSASQRMQANGKMKAYTSAKPQEYTEDSSEDDSESANDFQAGAIVRVKLTNFVTYESAEFFPGPSLNMVIGPNGTGKSSLVCAICLGLGWGPQHLGRAGQVGEFVKHSTTEAQIEIELYRKAGEDRNSVIRLRIIREENAREWWINGKKSSLKAVQYLVSEFRIQVDNLCQFLPQEKVASFANLSTIELLHQTQRAAAPEKMLKWHDNLKQLRSSQKIEEGDKGEIVEKLGSIEARLQNLDSEVQKLQERTQIQRRVDILRKTKPFVEYKIAVAQHNECKERRIAANKKFHELEESIQPILQSTLEKETYRDAIEAVANQRKQHLRISESDADRLTARINSLEEEISAFEQGVDAERDNEKNAKNSIQGVQRKIADLRARRNDEPPAFDSAAYNERIKVKESNLRRIEADISNTGDHYKEMAAQGRINRQSADAAEIELQEFDSQEGQLMGKLEQHNPLAARAWKWVQQNQNLFEKEIYGPPLITCSIKDPRFTAAIETLVRPSEALALTAQTLADFRLLSDKIHGDLRLTGVSLRSAEEAVGESRPLTDSQMQAYGLSGWAIDYVDGPGPVLAMLADNSRLDQCAVTLQEINDEQYNNITKTDLQTWVTASQIVNLARRREYGSEVVSTSRGLKRPTMWTDQPIDTSARREIQARIDNLNTEFEVMKREVQGIRQNQGDLKASREELHREIDEIKKEKAILQKARGAWDALPSKISIEEERLDEYRTQVLEIRKSITRIATDRDKTILRKAKAALEHKEQVSRIRACHEELLEAQIRLIEAESDVVGLRERNSDIVRQRDEEKQRRDEAEEESRRVRAIAKAAQQACVAIMSDPEYEDDRDQFTSISDEITVETLENEISAEEARLEFIVASNPNALRQWETFDGQAKELRKRLEANEEKLKTINRLIAKTQEKWEPELDKLVAKISEAFSFNFEQIGCAGEVSVHKDEEFEKWAIQIKVKFRENETLQLLDAQRQSGGERSVSTIFYLLSLQALAQAPFRVVDEINQGMDPRNERMVHERMVEIACKEHTSQYFLITPKLLTGLRYDRRMKVLCIASGEHMPDDYRKLDIARIVGIRRAIMAAA